MAAKRAKRIYWDSAVYIDRLEKVKDKIEVLRAITDAAESGRIVLLASTLVLAEVAKVDKHEGKDDEERLKKLAQLWENEFFVVQAVDRAIALRAAELVRTHKLQASDAIHVATAIALEADELQTYDEEVLACDGKVGQPPLAIRRPKHPSPLPLFEPADDFAPPDDEGEAIQAELPKDD